MAKTPKESGTLNLYQNKTSLRWIILLVSTLIGAGSIFYTNYLVKQIRDRETKQIELYANTLEYIANEYDNPGLNFTLEQIVQSNTTIPVILANESGYPVEFKNLPVFANIKDSTLRIHRLISEMQFMAEEHEPIKITFRVSPDEIFGYGYIYYKNSDLLTQLRYYPYIQLTVIAFFGFIAYQIFSYSKSAEQNQVWVGLAKETAHQLGTPLSSLMAWVEYFKTDENSNKEIVSELNKDIERLETITSRFSSIGSIPQLKTYNVPEIIHESIAYLEKRVSTRINFSITTFPTNELYAKLNKSLFEWVVENLCKNAVDAMGGIGDIKIKILRVNDGKIAVDISDTGKGIPKSKFNKVFQPGFTTKKRGWGLGLTLVKRIIENYHEGKIFVKSSENDKGTTFRILLKT